MMHRSNHGIKYDEESILIKGYVFVYTNIGEGIFSIKSDNNPFRILNKKIDKEKLFGMDYQYSKWVLEQNGFIGMSKAIKLNEKVKIVSGPLEELEG